MRTFTFFVLLFTATALHAQITGRVIDPEGDGLPLITIKIRAEQENAGQQVRTRKDGSFRYRSTPGVKYEVELQYAPGYYTEEARRQHVESEANVLFSLKKGGVVTGTVREEGRPLAGIEVFVQSAANSFRGETNDLGNYRIFGLPPGSYRVSAKQSNSSSLSPSRFQGQAGYYYPGGDRASALEIEVANNEINGINIEYQARPGYALAGNVALTIPMAFVTLFGEQQRVAYTFVNSQRQRFYFAGLQPGNYDLEVNGADTNGREYWGTGKASIKDKNEQVNLSLTPAGDLIVKLQTQGHSTCQAEKFTGKFLIEAVTTRPTKQNWEEIGSFTLRNLRPQAYRISIPADVNTERLYLQAKTYPLYPTSQEQELQLLTNGAIIKQASNATGIMQLIPVETSAKSNFQQVEIKANSYTFTNIAPGKYRVRRTETAISWTILTAPQWDSFVKAQPGDKEITLTACQTVQGK